MESHAEMRSMNCRNGFQWSAHFDPRYGSASKDVQQQLAGRSGQASRRLAGPDPHPLTGSNPLDLKPATVQPPTQEVAAAPNISP